MGEASQDFTRELIDNLASLCEDKRLKRILWIFQTTQKDEAAWVCKRLLEISAEAPWLTNILATGEPVQSLVKALDQLANQWSGTTGPNLEGRTEHFSELATLVLPKTGLGANRCMEVMRAVYVCALFQTQSIQDGRAQGLSGEFLPAPLVQITPTAIRIFGSSLRAIDRGLRSESKKALRNEYRKSTGCNPGQLARKLFADGATQDASSEAQSVVADWHRQWRPFLTSLQRQIEGETPLQNPPVPRSVRPTPEQLPEQPLIPGAPTRRKKSRRSMKLERHFENPAVVTLSVPALDKGFPTEDPIDSCGEAQIIAPSSGMHMPKKMSPGEKSEFIGHGISLTSNELLQTHISTMQAEELAIINPQLELSMRADVHAEFERKRNAVAAHLVGQLGCSADALASISFYDPDANLLLDLQRRVIQVRVLPPKNARQIAKEHLHKFDSKIDHLAVALTPACSEAISSLHRFHPASNFGDWFGDESIKACATRALDELEIPEFSKSLSRLRRADIATHFNNGRDIVLTQLSFNDDLHQGTAGLYYYAPLAKAAQEQFSAANQAESVVEAPEPIGPARIGAANILTVKTAQKGISEICNALNRRTTAAEARDPATAARIHNDFVSYLMLWIPIIASHRPHETLFRLTRWAFDLVVHYMIAQDKKIDAAHLTRICATTEKLSKTIENYLHHLLALSDQPWATRDFKQYVDRIVRGEAPLLAYINLSEGAHQGIPELRTAKFNDWLQAWPEIWAGVPSNWYRAFFSTHLRELDVEPCAVLAHMGHLQASGFPYSPDGVVSPEMMLNNVRKGIEKLERLLGFKVRRGFARLHQEDLPKPELARWSAVIEKHEKSGRALNRKARNIAAAQLRSFREKADAWLSGRLPELSPILGQLVSMVRSKETEKPAAALINASISEDALDEVMDALEADFADDSPALIATHNALARAINRAKKIYGLSCRNTGQYRIGPGTELAPFIPEQGMATSQMHDLRQHFTSRVMAESNDIPAVVRRAMSLILFGGFSDAEQICQSVVARTEELKVIRKDSVLVAEIADARICLTDACATTFLRTQHDQLPQEITRNHLSQLLGSFVPKHMRVSDRPNLLDYLCDLANLTNRYEISGSGRRQFGKYASLDATAEQQCTFIGNQMLGAPTRSNCGKDMPSALVLPLPHDLHDARKAEARSFENARYDALLSCINYGLPRPPPADSLLRSKRISNQVRVEAIEALCPLADHRGTIVDGLMLWAMDIARNGTARTADPKRFTQITYITAIGLPLVSAFRGRPIDDIDADEFLEAFVRICRKEGNEKRTKQRAQTQCRSFHAFLVKAFGVEPISWLDTELAQNDDEETRKSDLVSEPEFQIALQWLLARWNDNDGPDSWNHAGWRRACRITAIALIVLRRSGGRINEVAWLRFSDVLWIDTWFCILFRPFRFRGLKSHSARRLIDITRRLLPHEQILIREWLTVEKQRLSAAPKHEQFLFGDTGLGGVPFGAPRLRAMIKTAFKEACGRDVWPHLLRHSFVNEAALSLESLASNESTTLFELMRSAQRMTCEVGHSLYRTHSFHYLHMGWAQRRLSPSLANRHLDRWGISVVANDAVATVDKARQNHKEAWIGPRHDARQWLHAVNRKHSRLPILVPRKKGTDPKKIMPPMPDAPLGLPALEHLLTVARTEQEIRFLGPNYGLSLPACSFLWNELDQLAKEIGYRLAKLPTRIGTVVADPLPRNVTDSDTRRALQKCTDETASRMGALFRTYYQPYEARHDRLIGDYSGIHQLQSYLESAGVRTEIGQEKDQHQSELKFPCAEGTVSQFHEVCRHLAIVSVWASVRKKLANPPPNHAQLVTVSGGQALEKSAA